jgi:hypothetical protein
MALRRRKGMPAAPGPHQSTDRAGLHGYWLARSSLAFSPLAIDPKYIERAVKLKV